MSCSSDCIKVDLHTHILPRDYPNLRERYGYGAFVSLEHRCDGKTIMMKGDEFFREVEPNCFEPVSRIQDMDESGVHVQVLSTVPVMFSYWAEPKDTLDLCRIINNDIAETVKKYPKRFVGLGTLPMQSPEMAVEELRRCITELGLLGVEIGSNINGDNLDSPGVEMVLAEAEKLGAVVFVHPWEMMGEAQMRDYWLPWLVGMPAETSRAICNLIFSGLLLKYPNLKICFAHGGGSFPGTLARIQHGFEVRPDLCAIKTTVGPREQLHRIWVDSLVHDLSSLKFLLEIFGEDQIMLGTDYPFPLGELQPGKLIEDSDLLEEVKRKLLGENCLKFLNLQKEQFL